MRNAGVLRFVEDNVRVVERPSAHIGERDHLDLRVLHKLAQHIGLRHIGERIEERAKIRIDLFGEVAREEAEVFARFDRRSHQDDFADFAESKRLDRPRDGEVSLAGAGGPGAETDFALAEHFAILRLPGGFRTDRFAAVHLERLDGRDFFAALHFVERATQVVGVERFPFAVAPTVELFEQVRAALRRLRVVRANDQLPFFGVDDDANAQFLANFAQVFVARAQHVLQNATAQDRDR